MTTASPNAHLGGSNWLRRAEAWLDDRGKPAWIAAMVLGFIFFWPVGFALLAYVIWSNRMFTRTSFCGPRRHHRHHGHHHGHRHDAAFASSGNSAFDAYKSDTLRRLEEEQVAFEAFLQRLREAKDKSEFDTFMSDRASANRDGANRDGANRDGANRDGANRDGATDAPVDPGDTQRGGQY